MSHPRTATELFRLTLATDGAFPPEAAGDFLDLILSAFPPKPKASGKKFVPAEFPGELEEQVLDDIRTIAADNPRREAALAATPDPSTVARRATSPDNPRCEAALAATPPPSPDARAQEVARAAEAVRAAVRACFVGMRLKKPEVEHVESPTEQVTAFLHAEETGRLSRPSGDRTESR